MTRGKTFLSYHDDVKFSLHFVVATGIRHQSYLNRVCCWGLRKSLILMKFHTINSIWVTLFAFCRAEQIRVFLVVFPPAQLVEQIYSD